MLCELSDAKIRIERESEKIVRKEREDAIDSSYQQKKTNAGFCLSLALCSYMSQKKRRRDIIVVRSLFKEEEKEKNIRL